MNEIKKSKGSLAILESLYDLYRSNLDNKEILDHVAVTAWEMCFNLHAIGDGAFHSLAELAQGTRDQSIQPNPDSHYVKDIESTIKELRSDSSNLYEG